MPQHILPDILYEIIGHLRRETWKDRYPMSITKKWDLSSCTLVCHAWCAAARPHLFRDVVYSFCPPSVEPSDIVTQGTLKDGVFRGRWVERDGESAPCKTLPMFLEFLRETPRVASYISQLALAEDMWPDWVPPTNEEESFNPHLFAELFKLLPQLQALWLHEVPIHGPSYPNPQLRHPSISLRQVTITYAHNKSISYLANVLSLFEDVETLCLSMEKLVLDTRPVAIDSWTTPTIRARNLWLAGSSDVGSAVSDQVLSHFISSDHLRSLNILCSNPSAYQKVLDHHGSSIESLWFSLHHPRHHRTGELDGDRLPAVSLAACIHLRRITVFICLKVSYKQAIIGVLKDIYDFLSVSQITRRRYPELKDFVFEFQYDKFCMPGHGDGIIEPDGLGDELDKALVQVVRSTEVKKICFNEVMLLQDDYEEVETFIEKLFPTLRREGLMRFTGGCCPDWQTF